MTEEDEQDADPACADREGALWRETFEDANPGYESAASHLGKISERAVSMIIEFEVTSQAVYERRYRRPIWPGWQSGVTIGIGYDVGHTGLDRLRRDWRGVLPDSMIVALERAVGVKGPAARALATDLADEVDVSWAAARQVFAERTLPFWIDQVQRAVPNATALSPDSLGALVSLTFNRGASYSQSGDRYREMRAIKAHMAGSRANLVPAEIRSMKRLWPDSPGLRRRRDREADLFEAGLDQTLVGPNALAFVGDARDEVGRALRDALLSLADAPATSAGRRFFFPNGIGELEFEIQLGAAEGARLRLVAKDATAPTAEPPVALETASILDGTLEAGVQALLSSHRHHQLIGRVELRDTTFLLLDQFDQDAGGQVLIRAAAQEEPSLVAADSVLFAPGAPLPDISFASELAAAFGWPAVDVDRAAEPATEDDASSSAISERVYDQALLCVNTLSSRNVPGTNGGRLACAWAVNEVVRRALGRPIGGGLSTAKMIKVLRRDHLPLSEDEAEPGAIVISPTVGGVTGHVGIVGRCSGGEKLIYSNSSARALFVRNHTIRTWRDYYERRLGLSLMYYRLK